MTYYVHMLEKCEHFCIVDISLLPNYSKLMLRMFRVY